MSFPSSHATIYRNDAGEVLGWDEPSYDEPDYDDDEPDYDDDEPDYDGTWTVSE